MAATTTQFRTCPLCEATCGLEITMNTGTVAGVRGDSDDVFSHGFICPKGTAVKHLHEDPDRLRTPLVRTGGELRPASWEDAFAAVERGLAPLIERHGADSVALYIGNPTVHSLSASVLVPAVVKASGSKNFFSAATVDQMPKHVSCGYMFGSPTLIPVPDIDRADYLLVVGANPWVSNGSLATAPDFRGRIEAIRARGGKVVVVDPRRTETAAGATEHVFVRPGTDSLFLMALMQVLFEEGKVEVGRLSAHVDGLDEVRRVVEPFTPERAAPATGISAEVTRRIAHEFSASPAAGVYDRVGAHQQRFGTITSWASDVLTTITGNMDHEGGKMFALPAHGRSDPSEPRKKGWRTGRHHSRVNGHPEVFGQFPVATLADEIETPGDGQVRAFVTIAGNPVLSTPNGGRLARALETLEFMVAVDPFVNETTKHADVILPPPSILARHHYDFSFYGLSVRNIVNYSPPLVAPEGPDEWEILSRVALVLARQPVDGDPAFIPQLALNHLVQQATGVGGAIEGRNPDDILQALQGRGPVEQILDFRLRTGPFGDRFDPAGDGLSLADLEANPHGIDLGPLTPRLPNALTTASGKIELAPPAIVADIDQLEASLQQPPPEMVLIGRRQLRSNNSWMHNVQSLLRGSNKCTLLLNPADAERLGLSEGMPARIRSRVGEIEAPVELTDEMMPGVASLPHGWGHAVDGVRLGVAQTNPGVSVNDVTDDLLIDPLSGNASLNTVSVEIEPASEPARL